MTELQKLRQQRKDLQAEGREILKAAASNEHGNPSADQDKRLAEIDAELETLAGAIEAAEQRADRERAYAATEYDAPDGAPIEVRDLNPATTHGFHDMAEFALAVQAASPGPQHSHIDERLRPARGAAPTNYHQESGSDEGYMVPPKMRDQVYEIGFDDEDLIGLVDSEPTNSNAVGMVKDESTPWGSTGVQAVWANEASQMTPSKLDTDGELVKLNRLHAFVTATEELMEDAPRLATRLTRKSGEAIRWKASDAIVSGSGAGQPLGFKNSGALVTVAKESGQAADTLVAANIAKMVSRMISSGFKQAIWMVNQDVLPQLLTMTLGDQPIWTPPQTGFANAPGGFLFGRPVRFSEHCETLGDQGDIYFIDPMGYYLARKASGVQFATSAHLYFDYALTAFRWTFRLGGQPYLSAPVSPAKGSATRSHFVTLAARA